VDVDLRIVVTGQFPQGAPPLLVGNPSGAELRAEESPGATGELLTFGDGVAEYMVRRAIPGTYTIRFRSRADMTLRLAVSTHRKGPG